MNRGFRLGAIALPLLVGCGASSLSSSSASTPQVSSSAAKLQLNDRSYFQSPGLDVLVFNNTYNGLFDDSKISGIELIHHGVRTATNGDVRLHATPEQWDAIPQLKERKEDAQARRIVVSSSYPKYDFDFSITTQALDQGLEISVSVERPVPEALVGKAGLNLEFLPAAYAGKSFLIDGRPGLLADYPTGLKEQEGHEPRLLARGRSLVLAPEDPERRVTITTSAGELELYDGRGKAQNGWYVVRSRLPGGKAGQLLHWQLNASVVDGWTRAPVIAHSQVGYHPAQRKRAILELDRRSSEPGVATVYQVQADGSRRVAMRAKPQPWGQYARYDYAQLDFSSLDEPGIYLLEYGGVQTAPFPIARDVYEQAWQSTLDVYLPVQMDHVLVNEAYRVWHGASHLDDARQAPVDHVHFDLYAQGPTTDTPFAPGEHIPGLNVGGWYDAGDYDIRTQTQYRTVLSLVHSFETFGIRRDVTRVDYEARYVDLHVPDGKPDLLQQVEHGVLQLLAQHRTVGHAIPGIIVPELSQYTHLGDGLTMTDNLRYDSSKQENEADGISSGKADDRWAFTSYSSALNYGSIAALAAASRVLEDYDPDLARECLETAERVWAQEASQPPRVFRHGNTTGGPLESERWEAAAELALTTKKPEYKSAVEQEVSELSERFELHAASAVRLLPFLSPAFGKGVRSLTEQYAGSLSQHDQANPFGVEITERGWAGNGRVVANAIAAYWLHKAFPQLLDRERVLSGLSYLFGTHPGSDISFVSNVGAHSKKVAYGMNRADYSFIAGGVVPGVLMVKPDFPENKEDWPFLWGENEYVVALAASYLFLVHAGMDVLTEAEQAAAAETAEP